MKKLNQNTNQYRVSFQLNRLTKTAFALLIFTMFYSQTSYAAITAAMQGTNTCGTSNSGGVSVFANGGTGGYVYQWASSGTGATDVSAQTGSYITGVSTGTYFVTVTDGAAQSATGNVIVSNTVNNFTVSADATICIGDSAQLNASGADIYSWSPVAGLSNSNIASPEAFPTVTTTYTVTGYKSTGNLVFNGDFSQGNLGFTSGYKYISPAVNAASAGGNTGLVPEADYAVDNNAHVYHPRFWGVDHTTGTGNFMIVNGAETPDVGIWNQTVNNVTPNTVYFFSTWISSLNNINAYANLKFSINGSLIGPIINSPADSLHWIQFYVSWNSGSNTSAAISIVNGNTIAFGNDFGLDDISFTTVCPATQQVTVTVNQLPDANAGNDQTICAGQSASLTANDAGGNSSYMWSDGGSTQSVTVTPSATTDYYVTVTNSGGCSSVDSVTVFVPTDVIQPVAICKDTVLYLDATGNATIAALYIDGGSSDNCAVTSLTASETSFNCSNSGANTVTLTVTDGSGNTSSCISTVTVADSIMPVAICKDVTVTLVNGNATITESDINNGSYDNCEIVLNTASINSFNCTDIGANAVTLTVTDMSGNYSSCNATVTVLGQNLSCSITSLSTVNSQSTGGNPNTIYIGYGPQSTTLQVNVTGAGPFTYSWSPNSNLSCSNCASPTFTPTAEGNYHFTVTVINSWGCTTTCNITIHVRDIRGGGNGNKVYLCHHNNTLLISSNAVAAHIQNHSGDYLGKCNQQYSSNHRIGGGNDETEEVGELITDETGTGFDMIAYPNPFSSQINLRMDSDSKEFFAVKLFDIAGMLISDIKNIDAQNDFSFGSELASGVYLIEVEQSNFKKIIRIVKH